MFDAAIVTKIEPGRSFYPAEDYHQDFLTRNPNYPYIVINDLPKIENLKRLFPNLYRDDPVLVAASRRRTDRHRAVGCRPIDTSFSVHPGEYLRERGDGDGPSITLS